MLHTDWLAMCSSEAATTAAGRKGTHIRGSKYFRLTFTLCALASYGLSMRYILICYTVLCQNLCTLLATKQTEVFHIVQLCGVQLTESTA